MEHVDLDFDSHICFLCMFIYMLNIFLYKEIFFVLQQTNRQQYFLLILWLHGLDLVS